MWHSAFLKGVGRLNHCTQWSHDGGQLITPSYYKERIWNCSKTNLRLAQEKVLKNAIDFDSFGKKFETDTLATSLIPDDIETLSPQSFVGVKTSGNGNCLYNAASLFLCGNESLNSCLRLLTALPPPFFFGVLYFFLVKPFRKL